MSIQHIKEYHKEIQNLRRVSGSANETVLRAAFQKCLTRYCSQRDFTLLAELPYTPTAIPDATIKDSLRLTWGYWEAKDEKDDLDREIDVKIKRGYPTSNIIFEDSKTAVLLQNGEEVLRAKMSDAKNLSTLIEKFFTYEPPAIADFRKAIGQFKADLPNVLKALRDMIDQSHKEKPAFQEAADKFLQLCRKAINPEVEEADVREMLIQHILTKDIFLKIFGEDMFHKENNIAHRLDNLEDTFFTGDTRRETIDRLKGYYSAITVTAASIDSHQEKQKFLKAVYEDFYKVYNLKAADRLGVVYTPNEIVDFMIKATDELVYQHFARHLYDKKVQILDPAAGTGTFITDLIEFIPKGNLEYKYENEIHANEVGILPYYIANLNIEYTYKQKTGEYKEFPNICFVDTLDNLAFKGTGQEDFLGSMSYENLARVKRQNEQDISVIIGNPPYNANQRNWNDNNKNREYPGIDERIKSTYIKQSAAQKTKQYDMYKRFIRWASDRLGENGVLAFITNRSWIDKRQDDGFRKAVFAEFNEIYAIDLGGDIRTTPGAGNVFGIMTGVAIGFFVKRKKTTSHDNYYYKCDDMLAGKDKLAFLSSTAFSDINFEHIVPDDNGNWLNQTNNDFDKLLCIACKKIKRAKRPMDETAVFKLFSMGVATNRDEWVYDFDKKNIKTKVRFFIKTYNKFIVTRDESYNTIIKWSRDLRDQFKRNNSITYAENCLVQTFYRPFVKKFHFADFIMNDVLTKNHYAMFGNKFNLKNKVICFSGIASSKPFQTLAVSKMSNLDFLEKTQCLPLYRYDNKGTQHNNITIWGRRQFWEHYNNNKITAENIFHYTYAVLHHPDYLKKYAVNLKQEFPRLPFYDDFHQWVKWGKALMTLHIDFEKQPIYPLKRMDKPCDAGSVKLKADKEKGIITLDQKTQLSGIPPEAWKYKLGSRSALEWILDQYKEKKPKDPTIQEKFNTYQFHNHKEKVIDLLGRVCTVSSQTMEIVDAMDTRKKNDT